MTENDKQGSSELNPLLVERYKYVLRQKQALNDKTFSLIGIYQTVALALGAAIYVSQSAMTLSAHNRRGSLIMIFSAFEAMSALVCITLIAGIVSWMSYKRDEIRLEVLCGLEARDSPRWGDVVAWYETHFVAFVVLMAVLGPLVVYCSFL